MTPARENTNQHIPLPRQTPDYHIEHLPTTTSPVWAYTQEHSRGGDLRWTGYSQKISGREGYRLRNEIANVVVDLLRWATTHQHGGTHDDTGDDRETPGEQTEQNSPARDGEPS